MGCYTFNEILNDKKPFFLKERGTMYNIILII